MQAKIVAEIRSIGSKWKSEWLFWMVNLFENATVSDPTISPIVVKLEESCGETVRSFSLLLGAKYKKNEEVTEWDDDNYAKQFAQSRETMGYDGKFVFDSSTTSSSSVTDSNTNTNSNTRMIPLNLWFRALLRIYILLEAPLSDRILNSIRDIFVSPTLAIPITNDREKKLQSLTATAVDLSTNSICWIRIPREHFHSDIQLNISQQSLKWIGEWSPHLRTLSKDTGYGSGYLLQFLAGEIYWDDHTPSPYEMGTAVLFPRVLKLLFRCDQDQLTRASELSKRIFQELTPKSDSAIPSKYFCELTAFVDAKINTDDEHCDTFFGFARDELQLLRNWLYLFPLSPVGQWGSMVSDFGRRWTYENWMVRNQEMSESIVTYESLLTLFAVECRHSGQLPSALSKLASHYLPFEAN